MEVAPELTIRLSLGATPILIRAIDDWRRQQPVIPSRAMAARLLLEQALKAQGFPPAKVNKPAAKRKGKSSV